MKKKWMKNFAEEKHSLKLITKNKLINNVFFFILFCMLGFLHLILFHRDLLFFII
jgi:hypothetical protein